MAKKLEQWINQNHWIKESDTYKSGGYLKNKPETVPKLNFSNGKKLTSKKINIYIKI